MPDIGAPELIIILVAVLIIFGPGKLPDLGRTLGKSIKEFRTSVQELHDEPEALTTTPPPAVPSATITAATSTPVETPEHTDD
ncbi:MAG TPA: twin-arginine translocase TatA/TatE family subunit [Nitrolancea sp.]|nr:twin-arginine translocase TatA/TatE family subunit [Nitrolancea sp.]